MIIKKSVESFVHDIDAAINNKKADNREKLILASKGREYLEANTGMGFEEFLMVGKINQNIL